MALAVMVLCSQIAPVLLAQNSTPAPASAEAAAPASASETRPVQLSSGVPEILKLGRAHVGDEVIIAFIRNSGRTYHLSASEILYLREQGVSDQVLTAMLSAGQNVAANRRAGRAATRHRPTQPDPRRIGRTATPSPRPPRPNTRPLMMRRHQSMLSPRRCTPIRHQATAITTLGLTTGVIPRCRSVSDSGAVIMAATTGEAITAAAITVVRGGYHGGGGGHH